jgi:hypothetical protein
MLANDPSQFGLIYSLDVITNSELWWALLHFSSAIPLHRLHAPMFSIFNIDSL